MKLLVVDVGNTSTAVGLWSDGRVAHVAHCDGGFDGACVEAAALTGRHLVEGLAYLSVVPKMDGPWKRFASEKSLPFLTISSRLFPTVSAGRRVRRKGAGVSSQPLALDYPKPETIGADRLADAAAAVTADCVWRGGVIAPGFPLMRDYLYERTAKLPRMKLGGRCPKIGRSTEEAMRFGAWVGYRGMVREIVTTLSRNFKTEFKLVATGGFAKWVLRDIGLPFTIDPTLTLHGAGLLGKLALEG